ncbi:restriction endonuclease subunit S [Lysinibacillus boronitolerans]|nr:restriction endonuclease subunit S [Lysinibacillus boronitolerans]
MSEMREGYKMTELGEIPSEWRIKPIKEVADIVSGGTPSKSVKSYWENGEILWATPTDITKNKSKYIDKTELSITQLGLEKSSATLLPPGAILMTSRATIGERSIAKTFITTNQGFKSFICKADLNNEYMYYALEFLKPYFLVNASGSTFLEISKAATENQLMFLPLLKEQQKIASILSTVDEQIDKTEQLILKTKELKKGLMQKLLTKGIGHKEFKQTELGKIPAEWELIKIEELINRGFITSHIDGNHGSLYPRANEFIDSGIPYISANSIKNGRVNFEMAKYLSEKRASKFKKGVAKNGDVLFAHNATVGPVAKLKTDLDFVILSTSLTLFRCEAKVLSPDYLMYYLMSPLFINQYQKIMGQTTRNQVPITVQKQLQCIIPNIKEQQKIASILSTVDAQIEVYEEENAKYEELKKGLMQKLLTGQIRVKC